MKLDRNGYAPSIMGSVDGVDFIKHAYYGMAEEDAEDETVRHEIFYGSGKREISKREGLWIATNPSFHREIHKAGSMDRWLKQEGQKAYERTHSREEFMTLFGRNYL